MKFTISHTWAQEEYREFTIEAENIKEAEEIAEDYLKGGWLWEESYEYGDVLKNKMEIKKQ